jgi:3-dehydroquinate synthase
MAATLSQRLGLVDAALVQRLTALIEKAGLPIRGPQLLAHPVDPGASHAATITAHATTANAEIYLAHMRVDKKAEAGEIKFVVIDGPAKASVRSAPDALVREVIDACCNRP